MGGAGRRPEGRRRTISRERGAPLTAPIFSAGPEGVPPQSSSTPASLTKQGARIIFNDQTETRVNTRVYKYTWLISLSNLVAKILLRKNWINLMEKMGILVSVLLCFIWFLHLCDIFLEKILQSMEREVSGYCKLFSEYIFFNIY